MIFGTGLPPQKDFTWNRLNPVISRRLDYILCKRSILPYIINAHHIVTSSSDHKAVCVNFSTDVFVRGPVIRNLITHY